MVICSEIIETVSLSGYTKLSIDSYNQTKTFISRYKNRLESFNITSIFPCNKEWETAGYQREIKPHYLGGSGQPTFPITSNYARIELMKHKPWSGSHPLATSDCMVKECHDFIQDTNCPTSVKRSFERATP
jgi:hypothetical protein